MVKDPSVALLQMINPLNSPTTACNTFLYDFPTLSFELLLYSLFRGIRLLHFLLSFTSLKQVFLPRHEVTL